MPRDGQADAAAGPDLRLPEGGIAHLVGICGAGMKALAEVLIGAGWKLSGSDLSPANESIRLLCQQGLQFHVGHSSENIPSNARCLIYSPAIPPSNPERIEAQQRGMPRCSYSQMVGWLTRTQKGVCIAGTHGKSTTTAMTGWVLAEAGRDSSVVVGAELCDNGRSGRYGKGDFVVVESCEFNHSFLDYQPTHAAILNIETDHFDCYADLPAMVHSFARFAELVPLDGVLLANGDCPATMQAVSRAKARVVTFGMQSNCDWSASKIRPSPDGVQFEIFHHQRVWREIALRLHGDHNVQNALAAAALCAEVGVGATAVAAGLQTFGGVKRRFEVVGERDGVTLIDDYAHHPTAVRASLRTARQVYGSRRIWVAFQPHQISRTTALMDEFVTSFDDADEIIVVPVFAARESVTDEPIEVSRELARRIAERGKSARFVESLDRIIPTVDDATRPGDVLIAMGAGDIDRIHHERT